ncbi:alpha-amylase family glycosyl hydrolase [Planococcus salinarum]|uniref:alpha-amylase family glycosyl hydrolase n=1 Tax=Planococcus salinarum TaxID=622695 RepID=UPI000E3E6A59|nr:alpha-amylase family glycosyl hydrolase [Planococcus salinarum]TAA73190.1 alpha-amlyase [Planococcus salinarum]
MKVKWISGILSGMLLLSLSAPASAEEAKELKDESIYDVLVDRYFNKQIENDYEVTATDPAEFNGGDFAGLADQIMHIKDMGFTVLSIGPVFASATYDGREVMDYSQLERHYGTQEDFNNLLDTVHDNDMKLMIDIPTQSLSSQHFWVNDHPDWFTENADGTFALDTSNPDAQSALIEFASGFVQQYEVDGLRLQETEKLDPGFITDFSDAIKEIRDIYLISDAEMEPVDGLDAVVLPGVEETLRNSYKNFDQDTSGLPELMENAEGKLIQADSLRGSRVTSDIVEVNGFPPTRMRLLFTQLLTMPGIPVVQYGSEIAMNGEQLPESHQLLNMAVEQELIDHIKNLNTLRNSSAALRTGDLEVIHEEDGWLIYKRSNDEETWIIAINNSSRTRNYTLPAEVVGSDKQLQGLFESDVVRQETDGGYKITLDREIGETFHVIDERGFNKAYIAALIVLYVVFMLFLWIVWRKGRQRKADEAAKSTNETEDLK